MSAVGTGNFLPEFDSVDFVVPPTNASSELEDGFEPKVRGESV